MKHTTKTQSTAPRQKAARLSPFDVARASAVLSLGLSFFGTGANAQAPAAQAGHSAVADKKTGSGAAPYVASQFPGVMVRKMPAAVAPSSAKPAKTHKSWIYVKPGAPKSHLAPRRGTRGAGVWYELGKTSAGGTIAHVDSHFHPYSMAKTKSGHPVVVANGQTITPPLLKSSGAQKMSAKTKPSPEHGK